MLERDIEKAHVKHVESKGGVSIKFTSPQRRSVPDRIDLLGTSNSAYVLGDALDILGVKMKTGEIIKLANEIVAAAIQFTELKAPGKKASEAQEREHARLRLLGFKVNVKDHK